MARVDTCMGLSGDGVYPHMALKYNRESYHTYTTNIFSVSYFLPNPRNILPSSNWDSPRIQNGACAMNCALVLQLSDNWDVWDQLGENTLRRFKWDYLRWIAAAESHGHSNNQYDSIYAHGLSKMAEMPMIFLNQMDIMLPLISEKSGVKQVKHGIAQ